MQFPRAIRVRSGVRSCFLHVLSREFDGRFGEVTRTEDPNGVVTSKQYDSIGRQELEIRSALGNRVVTGLSGDKKYVIQSVVSKPEHLVYRVWFGEAKDKKQARKMLSSTYGPGIGILSGVRKISWLLIFMRVRMRGKSWLSWKLRRSRESSLSRSLILFEKPRRPIAGAFRFTLRQSSPPGGLA